MGMKGIVRQKGPECKKKLAAILNSVKRERPNTSQASALLRSHYS